MKLTALKTPQLLQNRAALVEWLKRTPGRRAVVMTMGALHQGHLDLVAQAHRQADQAPHDQVASATHSAPHDQATNVIVTIFVNPLQFGPGEDFDAYPRTLEADLAALTGHGVAAVYAPSAKDMYPNGEPTVRLDPGPLGQVYEGAIRPGHFAGVLTVVHKLLQRTHPDLAIFGRKDAQQLAVVEAMVRDLDLGVEIVPVPIRRDQDGLATSSRNRYLAPNQRRHALCLPQALASSRTAAAAGASPTQVRQVGLNELHRAGNNIGIDYFDVVDPTTFQPLVNAAGPPGQTGLLIAAIRVGQTRLIDNTQLTFSVAR